MRWMADACQHPDKQAGVAVILQGMTEGTGKTTLSKVLQIIFGEHGMIVDTTEGLLAKFNAHLEFCSFAAIEEVSFAGDHRAADQLKSKLTADFHNIEGKFRAVRQVPNRLHAMMTTNHEWAVQAGDGARRWFIVEVSNEKANDKAWFDAIYDGLKAGGYGQFLNLLLDMKLGDFTPAKELVRTKELGATQRRTAGTIFDWLMTSTERGELAAGPTQSPLGLGEAHSLDASYERYALWTKTYSGRKPDSSTAFKDRLGKILGKSAKRRVSVNGRREWHSAFPDADTLRSATLRAFNIHGREGGE
jgi:phage/plasmid-associated DNA primase